MSTGLKQELGLGEPQTKGTSPQGSTEQTDQFKAAFREGMAGLNRELQVVTAQASPAEHQPLEAQRTKLYEAFQKASAQIDPVDPAQADQAIQRVVAAVTAVAGKASAVATGVIANRDEWLKRETDLDDAMLEIGELEEAGHPKAAALRKLGEAIRSRANDRKYQESVAALEQMRPKLEQIYAQHLQQADTAADAASVDGEAGDGAPREGLSVLVKDKETGAAIEGKGDDDGDPAADAISPEEGQEMRKELEDMNAELEKMMAELAE